MNEFNSGTISVSPRVLNPFSLAIRFFMAFCIAGAWVALTRLTAAQTSEGEPAPILASHILDARLHTLAKDDGGPAWQEMQARLDALFADKTPQADEAVVILMSFYLGEHYDDEVQANLLSRGSQMIPLLEKYLQLKPALLFHYPRAMRMDRKTIVNSLNEKLEILTVRSGAHKIARMAIETTALRELSPECALQLEYQAEPSFADDPFRQGESYRGAPVFRITITQKGEVTDVQQLSHSGIQNLDTALLNALPNWKYSPRPYCGAVQANIVVSIHWKLAK